MRPAVYITLHRSDVLLCDWVWLGLGVVIGVYTAAPRLSPYPWQPSSIDENRCVLAGVSHGSNSTCAFVHDPYLVRYVTTCCTSAHNTSVAQFSAYDDDGDGFTFTLLSDGGGPLSLTTDGRLFVDTAKGWLNYEVSTGYTLSVMLRETSNRVSGSPLLFAMQGNVSQSVRVVDVNEYPYFVVVPASITLDEESVYPTTVTPQNSNVSVTTSLNPLVSSWTTSAKYIMVYDEDIGNNSALVVTASSFGVGTSFAGYFEIVAANGSACRGAMNCTLRVRAGAPRIDTDATTWQVSAINLTLSVMDSVSLATNSTVLSTVVNDINQGECGWCGNHRLVVHVH